MNFKCRICFYEGETQNDLTSHYVKCHKNDPEFSIKCVECGATYKKWKSFQKHLLRGHTIENPGSENNEDPVLLHEEPLLQEEVDVNFDEENVMDPLELLEMNAAYFVMNIRENCKTSQTTIDKIIEGTTDLINTYLKVLLIEIEKRKDCETEKIDFQQVTEAFTETIPPSIIFESVKTKYLLDQVLINKFNMVNAEPFTLGYERKFKKRKVGKRLVSRLVKINHDAYIVPFLPNMTQLLNNPEIRYQIDNPKPYKQGLYSSVLDGSVYRENDFFHNNDSSIGIILHCDGVGLSNPLGSASKSEKVMMFYWTIANIYPEHRSNLNCIQLYAITKNIYLTKHPNSFDKILEPLIRDMKIFKNKGIDIDVDGQIKNYKGTIIFCSADTPAAALFGGFKESVSAHRLCRSCMVTKEHWQDYSKEINLELRNEVQHEEQLATISDNLTKGALTFWKKFYGVTRRSPLTQIIDVTTCLPHDIMHVIVEGVLKLMIQLYLMYCINTLRLFSTDEFNHNKNNFDFAQMKNDKPADIDDEHLENGKTLRQSAAQLITLANTLLFLTYEWTSTCEDEGLKERTECFVILLQILNMSLAYEVHEESINHLGNLITLFFMRFKKLYSDQMIPKIHFLLHLPRYLRLFGPLRQQANFRFEGQNAYFKSFIHVLRNFKNMALSLCYRHQARLCTRLIQYPGMPSRRFLYKGDQVSPGNLIYVHKLPFANLFVEFIADADWLTCKMTKSPKITINSTTYSQKSIVLVSCHPEDLPVFAEIEAIFILNELKLFVLNDYETLEFECKLNAYRVQKPLSCIRHVISTCNLIFPHAISSFKANRILYIPLLNHERTELY